MSSRANRRLGRLLGTVEGGQDRDLAECYVELPGFARMRDGSKYVVMGPMGSGKSALKKYFVDSAQGSNQIVITPEAKLLSGNITTLLGMPAGQLQGMLEAYMLATIATGIFDADRSKVADPAPILRLSPFGMSFVGRLVSESTQTFAQCMNLLFDVSTGELEKTLECGLDHAIKKSIKSGCRVMLFIDEIDSCFRAPREAKALGVVEAMIRAAKEINEGLFDGQVSVILLLRSEIYADELPRMPDYLQRIVGHIWELTWHRDYLRQFAWKRLRAFAGLKDDDNESEWKTWARYFVGRRKNDIQRIQDYLVLRSLAGPRDLQVFVDDFARQNGSRAIELKLALSDLEQVSCEFGAAKLRDINTRYEKPYDGIDKVATKLFEVGGVGPYKRDDLEKVIATNLRHDPSLSDLPWIRGKGPTNSQIIDALVMTRILQPEQGSGSSRQLAVHPALRDFAIPTSDAGRNC